MNPTLHVVITGTSRGIGLELVRQTLKSGHHVTALARKPESASELQSLKMEHDPRLKIIECDVQNPNSVRNAYETLKPLGAIDILINNAGVYLDAEQDFESLDFRNVLKSFEINSIAPMDVTRTLLSLLQKSKHPRLINITSLMGSIEDNSSGGSYAYRMSKTALNMFTRSFARDYPEITAFVMHPGWVKTDMGGLNAPTAPTESAQGILSKALKSSKSDSGRFFDFEGEELPW